MTSTVLVLGAYILFLLVVGALPDGHNPYLPDEPDKQPPDTTDR